MMTIHQVIIDWLHRRDRRMSIDSHELVNLTILALTQIGLNVGTVLLASVMDKWSNVSGIRSMPVHEWLCIYGWLALAVPPIWLGITISKRSNPDTSNVVNLALLVAGWAIVAFWLWIAYRQVLPRWIVNPCGGLV